MLTTPMIEESNWASARRRSSAALRIRCLGCERPSFLAISERSIVFFFCKLGLRDWKICESEKWGSDGKGIFLFYFEKFGGERQWREPSEVGCASVCFRRFLIWRAVKGET